MQATRCSYNDEADILCLPIELARYGCGIALGISFPPLFIIPSSNLFFFSFFSSFLSPLLFLLFFFSSFFFRRQPFFPSLKPLLGWVLSFWPLTSPSCCASSFHRSPNACRKMSKNRRTGRLQNAKSGRFSVTYVVHLVGGFSPVSLDRSVNLL